MNITFKKQVFFITATILLTSFLTASNSYAKEYVITINGNQITPDQGLVIPADQEVPIVIRNTGFAPIIFSCPALNIEIPIPENTEATIDVGPIEPGKYEVFDKSQENGATGNIIVIEGW